MAQRLYIVGITGRMGQAICQVASDHGLEVAGGTGAGEGSFPYPVFAPDASESPEAISEACGGIDVIIDFSGPDGCMYAANIARTLQIPLVSGSTGLAEQEFNELESLSQSVAVLWGSNMSLGINLLTTLLPAVTDALGERYDVEIVDIHHNQKKDAPSGTAITLADAIQQSQTRRDDARVYGREGFTGARNTHEIGVHALRAGDVVGDHTVYFCGPGERIELVHRAHSRETFARGAVRAAEYLLEQPVGLYTMKDVLGLE